LITETIGRQWTSDAAELSGLLKYKGDTAFLSRLKQIKRENKLRLAEFIGKENNIIVNPDSLFDVQVKRIHAYKRQLLYAFKIMHMYNVLKQNPEIDADPVTFIMAGKAAQGYTYAKEIIKLLTSIAEVVNNDPAVSDKLKVVFIENFGVSIGQLIYPAADVSEQISTAGKEASGTGNMKFMLNGAVTLGTADGANIEILERVGAENIFIFGLKEEEVLKYYKNKDYISFELYQSDKRLSFLCDQLTKGFFKHDFSSIYDSLLHYNDTYFVMKDFDSYIKTSQALGEAYKKTDRWADMSLSNIAEAGYFSSDRAVSEYMRNIWSDGRDINRY
jgi:glycogen phosphorylase